ncbi:MAG TPA: AraC family transcriptional regulator [Chitinophagaceae bacterium]|nr:AraC family transcriptional regulator [Chitinophagaceae bacterium]
MHGNLPITIRSNDDGIQFFDGPDYAESDAFPSFSLKTVLAGRVAYLVDARQITVGAGYTYLTCGEPCANGMSKTAGKVKVLSINISNETFSKAADLLHKETGRYQDIFLNDYFCSPNFFDRVARTNNHNWNTRLAVLSEKIQRNNPDLGFITEKWFIELAKEIIVSESEYFNMLSNLDSLKKLTARKEILSRLLEGRSYIDEHYLRNPYISEVAAHCCLSLFYFYRAFRQAFGVTPYNYCLRKRLVYALQLMANDEMSYTDIALRCGFPDNFTFSKAFKREYAHSPSKYSAHLKLLYS